MRLIVCETGTSTWHYHVRALAEGEKPAYGGGKFKALCGYRFIGWDVEVSVEIFRLMEPELMFLPCAECREKLQHA